MNIRNKSLTIVFLITFLSLIILPALFPVANFFYFAPLIIISFYQKPLITCLWYALVCGLFIDVLSDSLRLGFFATNYCITAFILFPQRKNFFSDSITTLPLMTFLFSFISTVLQTFTLYSINKPVALSAEWFFSELIIMPAIDSLYAFAFFILPFAIFGKRQRTGSDYFVGD